MIKPISKYKQMLNLFTSVERIDTHWEKVNDKVDKEALEEIRESYLGNKVNILV